MKTSIIGLIIILSAYGMAYMIEKIITGNYFAQCSGGVCVEVEPAGRTNSDPYAQDFYQGQKDAFDTPYYQPPK